MATFTIGSPLIARPFLHRYPDSGLQVPVRLNIVELKGGVAKSSMSWDLPSSLVAIGALEDPIVEKELKEGVQGLDARLEALVRDVLGNPIV